MTWWWPDHSPTISSMTDVVFVDSLFSLIVVWPYVFTSPFFGIRTTVFLMNCCDVSGVMKVCDMAIDIVCIIYVNACDDTHYPLCGCCYAYLWRPILSTALPRYCFGTLQYGYWLTTSPLAATYIDRLFNISFDDYSAIDDRYACYLLAIYYAASHCWPLQPDSTAWCYDTTHAIIRTWWRIRASIRISLIDRATGILHLHTQTVDDCLFCQWWRHQYRLLLGYTYRICVPVFSRIFGIRDLLSTYFALRYRLLRTYHSRYRLCISLHLFGIWSHLRTFLLAGSGDVIHFCSVFIVTDVFWWLSSPASLPTVTTLTVFYSSTDMSAWPIGWWRCSVMAAFCSAIPTCLRYYIDALFYSTAYAWLTAYILIHSCCHCASHNRYYSPTMTRHRSLSGIRSDICLILFHFIISFPVVTINLVTTFFAVDDVLTTFVVTTYDLPDPVWSFLFGDCWLRGFTWLRYFYHHRRWRILI